MLLRLASCFHQFFLHAKYSCWPHETSFHSVFHCTLTQSCSLCFAFGFKRSHLVKVTADPSLHRNVPSASRSLRPSQTPGTTKFPSVSEQENIGYICFFDSTLPAKYFGRFSFRTKINARALGFVSFFSTSWNINWGSNYIFSANVRLARIRISLCCGPRLF